MQEIASKTKKLVQDAMNPATGSSVDIVPLAKSLLGEIKSMLNTSFNGQYLFSGSKMSTAPVGDIVNNTNVFLDTPTANYYDGDEDKAKSKISEGTVMDYGVTADDGVFQKLIGSLHSLIEGSLTSDVTKITLASQWAEESTAGITPKIANVGSNMAAVESQLQIDEKLTLRLQEHLSGIEDADIVALSSEALIIETQLRATYMLMTRANSMSLADYL